MRSRLLSPFNNDTAAREALEALRWPDGPRCPRCNSRGSEVFRIGGEKQSHREGLYQCKPCRRQFSITVGTVFERLRVPLSTWVRAAHAFSYEGSAYGKDGKPPLTQLEREIGVSYRTVLRMRDIIKRAAARYRGYHDGFGAWPRSFMKHKSNPSLHASQHAIRSTGVLAAIVQGRSTKGKRAFDRTEKLLRLLLANAKPNPRKRRFGL